MRMWRKRRKRLELIRLPADAGSHKRENLGILWRHIENGCIFLMTPGPHVQFTCTIHYIYLLSSLGMLHRVTLQSPFCVWWHCWSFSSVFERSSPLPASACRCCCLPVAARPRPPGHCLPGGGGGVPGRPPPDGIRLSARHHPRRLPARLDTAEQRERERDAGRSRPAAAVADGAATAAPAAGLRWVINSGAQLPSAALQLRSAAAVLSLPAPLLPSCRCPLRCWCSVWMCLL